MKTLGNFILLNSLLTSATLDLPSKHSKIYRHRHLSQDTTKSENNAQEGNDPVCYGYEAKCAEKRRFEPDWPHSCSGSELRRFWQQGDFGYVRQKLDKMIKVCHSGPSSLICTERIQFCQAEHLFLDLRTAKTRRWPDHIDDVFNKNEIGGNCLVDNGAISRESTPNLNGGLRSWFSELKNFSEIPQNSSKNCDLTINKPVVFMKLDQGENMYHRMCDFFNLYISLHVNGSVDFSKDFLIVKWAWRDAELPDYFAAAWDVFSRHPLVDIKEWFGKRVCIPSAIFSSLPRMVLGLFYNTPLGDNCWGSGMMKSFSQFFLHRMRIKQVSAPDDVIRVTFLVRRSTNDRKITRTILNEAELIDVMKGVAGFEVQVVEFSHDVTSLRNQLSVTHNTDLFVSIHGAGLTHLLFLPDWAVVFELYDMESKCFRDLARLRGVHHLTWQDTSKLKKQRVDPNDFQENNPRYYDYYFDPVEFKRLLLLAKTLLDKPVNQKHNEL